jgi:hypothetical protein
LAAMLQQVSERKLCQLNREKYIHTSICICSCQVSLAPSSRTEINRCNPCIPRKWIDTGRKPKSGNTVHT